jgi:hypothetical protein
MAIMDRQASEEGRRRQNTQEALGRTGMVITVLLEVPEDLLRPAGVPMITPDAKPDGTFVFVFVRK